MRNNVRLPAQIEDRVAMGAILIILVLLAVNTVLVKLFSLSLNSQAIVHHLVLWIALLGGTIASRENKHLAIGNGLSIVKGNVKLWFDAFSGGISCLVSTALAIASLSFVLTVFEPGQNVLFFPIGAVSVILPVGFGVIAARFFLSIRGMKNRLVFGVTAVFLGAAFALGALGNAAGAIVTALGHDPMPLGETFEAVTAVVSPILKAACVPFIVVLIASSIFGTPIFVLLGGLALFFFYGADGFIESIPNEAYAMLTGNLIPAIPLFTLAGFILSESKAGKRLVGLFRALFGAIPGGHVIMTVFLCALFTTLTGGSGVTILAIGGLLLFILEKNGYDRTFTLGLLTSSGSTGLHFPPSLPLIMYGVVTELDIKHLFIGGFLPGLLMIAALSAFGVVHAVRRKIPTFPFSGKRAWLFVRGAFWELLFPVIIVGGYFSGLFPLVETSAFACIYVIVVYVFIKRDLRLKDLPTIVMKSLPVMGGVLIIIACAQGFKYFIVDAEIPVMFADWMSSVVASKYVFLLLLNLALLVTGCFIDIISAVLVVAPLIVPLGQAYGIHPVHLGIIFIANLELGYLTPPVGINLFLASYRFNEPMTRIYRSIVPFLLVMLAALLVITYIPFLTTGLLGIFGF